MEFVVVCVDERGMESVRVVSYHFISFGQTHNVIGHKRRCTANQRDEKNSKANERISIPFE